MQMSKKHKSYLDNEEQEILDFFEQEIPVSLLKANTQEKTDAIVAAKNFLRKTERINIRMNAYDLNHIKRHAAQQGIPYQTLISSILHKYASGHQSRQQNASNKLK